MSPAHVLEPTYAALRERIAGGAWQAGTRLEAVPLADDLGVSITPVRDCLHRLAGERLVLAMPGNGFFIPLLDETEARALLGWHQLLVTKAIDQVGAPRFDISTLTAPPSHTARTARLFETIAAQSRDPELFEAVRNAGARLGRIRHVESSTFPQGPDEIDTIIRASSLQSLRRLVADYHARRLQAAASLVHLARTA